MTHRIESPGVLHEQPRCPLCATVGWLSTIRVAEATAVCGSRWDAASRVVGVAGPACSVIEHKNDLIDQLEYELAAYRMRPNDQNGVAA